jgi:hypothetical protein
VPEPRVKQLVTSCGVGFTLTAESRQRLVKAGVPESLLSLLPRPAGAQLDLEFWRSVKDSGDTSLLQGYLDKFPDGMYRPIAEQRLKAAIEAHRAARVKELRKNMPGLLASHDWDRTDQAIHDLSALSPAGDKDSEKWRSQASAGRKADRVEELQKSIPGMIAAERWEESAAATHELLQLIPEDKQADEWRQRVSAELEGKKRAAEAAAQKERIADLRAQIGQDLDARRWDNAEAHIQELTVLEPPLTDWKNRILAGRKEDSAAEQQRVADQLWRNRVAGFESLIKRGQCTTAQHSLDELAHLPQSTSPPVEQWKESVAECMRQNPLDGDNSLIRESVVNRGRHGKLQGQDLWKTCCVLEVAQRGLRLSNLGGADAITVVAEDVVAVNELYWDLGANSWQGRVSWIVYGIQVRFRDGKKTDSLEVTFNSSSSDGAESKATMARVVRGIEEKWQATLRPRQVHKFKN